MNKLVVYLLFALSAHAMSAQTVTSVSDGEWSVPTTWDCSCVPGNGQDIVVMHHIEIEDWVAVNSGSLMVMEEGYLDGFFGDGSIYLDCETHVYGVIDCTVLQVDIGGGEVFANHGYVSCMYILNERDNFHNAGFMDVTDSVALEADIINEPAGEFTASSIGGPGTFTNHGNASIGSGGMLERVINTDTLDIQAWTSGMGIKYLSNSGHLVLWGGTVDTLLNSGFMEMATVHIARSYAGNGGVWVMPQEQHFVIDSTAHATISAPGAMFVSDGDLQVFGLLDGDGQACVAHETLNNGAIAGTIDICDLSPTATEWPFVDVNNGSVEATVTFCQAISCTVSVPEVPMTAKLELFPVPATDHISLRGGVPGDRLVIFDPLGRILFTSTITDPSMQIPLNALPGGCYTVSVSRPGARMTARLIVQ